MNQEFVTGVFSGFCIAAAAVLFYRAHQYGKAMDLTEFDQRMSHDILFQASQSDRLVVLMDVQAEDLCEEFANYKEQLVLVQSHLDEALTRKSELHKEISQMARVANDLQEQLHRSRLETEHCRVCCEELREKMGAPSGEVVTRQTVRMSEAVRGLKRTYGDDGRAVVSASMAPSAPVPDNSALVMAATMAAITASDTPCHEPVSSPSSHDTCSSSSSSYDSGSSYSSSSYDSGSSYSSSSSSGDSGSGGW